MPPLRRTPASEWPDEAIALRNEILGDALFGRGPALWPHKDPRWHRFRELMGLPKWKPRKTRRRTYKRKRRR